MKNIFRILSPIVSMLPRAVAVVGAFTYIFTASSVQAACSPKSGACPPNQQIACSYTSGGITAEACCSDGAACTAYRQTLINSVNSGTAGTAGTAPQGKGVLKVDPTAGCGNGINTGLGCIPYDTDGFTAALLGFLAGTVGIIALIVMMVATVMIMTGGSNPEQVKKGKELFTGGVTGLFFIIFSVTILRIIAGDIIKLPGF